MESLIKEILALGNVLKDVTSIHRMHGGCINDAFCVTGNKLKAFIKINSRSSEDMFEKEIQGLELLRSSRMIQIPEVLDFGQYGKYWYLILSYITPAPATQTYWENFGNALASLHKITNPYFGLDHDNYIGALPQKNSRNENWITFFIMNRIEALISDADLSLKNSFEKLFKKLPEFLPQEEPALLHGDLWSGNILCGTGSVPALVDPAVYFGHREMELAYTTLFGGFDERFYDAYNEHFPLQSGYKERYDIYNIYPLLVHNHLFGGSYLSQVCRILKKFV